MDADIYTKLKLKPELQGVTIGPPSDYPDCSQIGLVELDEADFVHIFVENKAQFEERVSASLSAVRPSALVWLSYPKITSKHRSDINRDTLWDLVLPLGWHPVAQVSLGDTWSAIRLRPNEAGRLYRRPEMRKG